MQAVMQACVCIQAVCVLCKSAQLLYGNIFLIWIPFYEYKSPTYTTLNKAMRQKIDF